MLHTHCYDKNLHCKPIYDTEKPQADKKTELAQRAGNGFKEIING